MIRSSVIDENRMWILKQRPKVFVLTGTNVFDENDVVWIDKRLRAVIKKPRSLCTDRVVMDNHILERACQ